MITPRAMYECMRFLGGCSTCLEHSAISTQADSEHINSLISRLKTFLFRAVYESFYENDTSTLYHNQWLRMYCRSFLEAAGPINCRNFVAVLTVRSVGTFNRMKLLVYM
jgi:hypothetical protein